MLDGLSGNGRERERKKEENIDLGNEWDEGE